MLTASSEFLKASDLRKIKEFGQGIAELGQNFFVYDNDLNILQHFDGGEFVSDFEEIADFAAHVLGSESRQIQVFGSKNKIIAVNLTLGGKTTVILVINTVSTKESDPSGMPLEVDDEAFVEHYKLLLQVFTAGFESEIKGKQQIGLISNELAQTYEELMLLYKMSANMKVSQSDSNYMQIACDNITELVNVEGIAIFLEKKVHYTKELVMVAGSGLIAIHRKGDNMHDIIYERLLAEMESGADVLLDSEIYSPFKYEWFGKIRNIIAVPMYGKDKVVGMMVATNRVDKPDFDSIDAKLFNSVANQCAVFMENNSLFRDLRELFIGSLTALTNSIDAKDQYTRGHSERVAFISRWIAECYAETHDLAQDQIRKIYIAGLLHDIGKIGISETVLTKTGKLTDEEYAEIKNHPQIGAGILSNIKQMSDIVPGVLCHHERYDGKGYPNGLKGDDIPLVGKIVMIADTFDAMTSKRTYRESLSVETAISEIDRGLGEQFAPEVGKIFINSDIAKLWQILQNGRIDDYYSDNFSDYGAIAVGALLR